MKTITTLVAFFMCIILWGQSPSIEVHGGEVEIPRNTQPCITEEQYEVIFNEIDLNISQLKREGRYIAPNRQGGHPLFTFPVAQEENDTFEYNSPFGYSNYVDHNFDFPNQVQDFNCGSRTYDTTGGYNHDGYDIFTWPFWWQQMDRNQTINIAGADGQIVFKLDGLFDMNCAFSDDQANAIVLEHFDGSRSVYLHFKEGTLTDKEVGDTVEEGEYLGVIGSSGSSTGPHLHFGVFDNNNELIDPSIGTCNDLNEDTWWQDPIDYFNPGINAVLTHTEFPQFNSCPQLEDTFESNQFDSGEEVTWAVYLTDQLANTALELRTIRPDGSIQFDWEFDLTDQFQLSWWAWQFPTDMDGTWTWEVTYLGETVTHNFEVGVLGIEDQLLNDLKLYPNPTSGAFKLDFTQPFSNTIVTVTNLLGQTVSKRELFNEQSILLNVEGAPGLYFVEVNQLEKGLSRTFKVIKN